MRKNLLLTLLVINIFHGFSQSRTMKRIGINNPTEYNLDRLLFLIHHNYIKVDSFQIVCIFQETQKELIESAKQYIHNHGYNNISFEIVHRIPFDSLFCKNSSTSDFLQIFKKTDAMIFFGGADIPPKIYGEETFLTTEIIAEERNRELSFLYHLVGGDQNNTLKSLLDLKPDYLVLGICLGMQQMNVANGGTLYQDIPFQIYGLQNFEAILNLDKDQQHKNYRDKITNDQENSSSLTLHHIKVLNHSFLEPFTNKTNPFVVSIHHQCVRKIGKDYKIGATAMDGKVVEAIENIKYKNVYGVQFHPEGSNLYKDNTEFRISTKEVLQLDSESRQFHSNFWKNFSDRLEKQR